MVNHYFSHVMRRECTGKGCKYGWKQMRHARKAHIHHAGAMEKAGTTNACKKWGQRYNYWLEKTWQQAPASVMRTRRNKMKAANDKRIWHCGLTPQPTREGFGLGAGRVSSGQKPKARYFKWGKNRTHPRTGAPAGRLWGPYGKFKHAKGHRWREER